MTAEEIRAVLAAMLAIPDHGPEDDSAPDYDSDQDYFPRLILL